MNLLKNILLLGLMIGCSRLFAQDAAVNPKDFQVTIHGSSNLHDWTETAERVTGHGSITKRNDGSFDLKELTIEVDVLSIKSTEGGIMNSKTYQALKAGKYPRITFTLAGPLKLFPGKGEGYVMKASGNLFIAGVTRPVNVLAKVFEGGGGEVSVEGMQKINMSDYGIDPPTAMMGMLKVRDAISIYFKASFTIDNI